MAAVRVSGELRAAVVASPVYLARHPVPLHPRDLDRHRYINRRYTSRSALHRWEFAKGDERLTVR